MTSRGRDVKDLKTWQEAFDHPIATTRQIEKQLRNDIAANKERLRTLVGASYRDLLETAERIVQLDERMQETERLLGNISLQCNLETIDKKAHHLTELQQDAVQKKSRGRLLAAQLTLLHRCQTYLPRLLRRGVSVLIAAKVLAISRLLIKTIGDDDEPPPILESIRNQLSSQRRRLLARIGTILTSPKSTFQEVINAICAFCIATSSSSSDAIRHFHDLRLVKIRQVSKSTGSKGEDVLAGFEYYLQSLRTTKELGGRQFADALRELRSQPILRSPDIQSLEDLDVASVQQFIPAEILSFVPWIKHEDTRDTGISSVLEKWSSIAFKAFSPGLKQAIDELSNVSELLQFRTRLLQIWLPVSASTPTHSNSEIFQELRAAFNNRVKEVLQAGSQSLPALASQIESALKKEGGRTLMEVSSIWDHDFVTSPLDKGATAYKKQLIDRYLGKSKSSKSILTSLQKGVMSISRSLEEIHHLRKKRWIDVIEEDEGGDEQTEQLERMLQKDDPDIYEQEHKSSLDTALLDFQKRIEKAARNTENINTRKTIFLLRLIRSVYQYLDIGFPQQNLLIFSSLIPYLQQILATNIATILLDQPRSPFIKPPKTNQLALVHLWSGEPPLPTHPSPRTFKLLQRLTALMEEQGPDVWSPDAVVAVKQAVRQKLVDKDIFHTDSLNGPRREDGPKGQLIYGNHGSKSMGRGGDTKEEEEDKDMENGVEGEAEMEKEEEEEEKADSAQQISTQNLFDMLYLSHALQIPDRESDNTDSNFTVKNHIQNDGESKSNKTSAAAPQPQTQAQSQPQSQVDSQPPTFDALLHQSSKPSLSSAHVDPAALTTLEGRAREYWARTALLFGLLAC